MAAATTNALIPHLVVDGAAKAVEFYKAAFGAEVVHVMPDHMGTGRVMHAHLKVLGADLFLNDDFPEYCGGVTRAPKGPTPVTLHLCVPNADEAMAKAAAAGGTITMPAADMFWGDRYGKLTDPFGHDWSFTHPLTAEQTKAAQAAWEEFMKQQPA